MRYEGSASGFTVVTSFPTRSSTGFQVWSYYSTIGRSTSGEDTRRRLSFMQQQLHSLCRRWIFRGQCTNPWKLARCGVYDRDSSAWSFTRSIGATFRIGLGTNHRECQLPGTGRPCRAAPPTSADSCSSSRRHLGTQYPWREEKAGSGPT